MKGKNEFSENEANQIRILIKQKLLTSSTEQKGIRNKIRDLKFYPFSSKFVVLQSVNSSSLAKRNLD
jgi:hypothetical protein